MKKKKIKTENPDKQPNKLKLTLRFLSGCKKYFIITMILSVLVSLLDLQNPKIIGFTIDSVIGNEPHGFTGIMAKLLELVGGTDALKQRLWLIAIAVGIVSLFGLVAKYLYRLYNSIAAETLVLNMRRMLFSHIERLPFKWHGDNQTGDIIQRCTSDVDMVKRFLSDQLTAIFQIVVMIGLSLFFMFSIDLTLALIALASIPVIITYSLVFHKHISKHFKECDEAEGVLSSITQENLTGVRVVRAFGREKFERDRFHKQSGLYAELWIKLSRLFSLFWTTGDLISGLQTMLIIVIGSAICVEGGISVGEFVEFVSYNGMLIWPVRRLGRMVSQMSQAGVSLDRIAYIMNSEEEQDKPETVSGNMSGDIVFDNVSFSYDGKTKVLDSVSFEIKSGTTFGILGGTGSGKSTLMYLLDRLYDLPKGCGKITVGGVDISDMTADELRSNIGIVMQEPFLFSRTIAENIGITGNDDENTIKSAAAVACLGETVEGFTDGYDTVVGERGVTLSGGQKQRTAIARMLTQNAPIMIFDDSLSAVDAETDAKIRRALREKTGDATVILISHRTSTLMQADKILVLDHGKVSDVGSHDELLSRDGIYRKIYDIQMQIKDNTDIEGQKGGDPYVEE